MSDEDSSQVALRAVVALATCAGALLMPSMAHATVIDVDYFKLTENKVDFGDGSLHDISGRPTQNGRLEWDRIGGELHPRLSGKLFLNNTPGGCGRMQLVINWSGADLTFNDSGWCAPDGATWYAHVGFAPFSHSSITSVTVRLQYKEDVNDSWATVESSTWIPT